MALNCLLRTVPKSLPASTKFYIGGNLVKSSVLATLKPTSFSHNAGYTTLHLFPACTSKVTSKLNLYQQVKEFSVSPKSQAAAGSDHSKLWSIERFLSVGLLGTVPIAFMFPNLAFDTILAVGAVMHNHWGVEAIVVDYVRPIIFGPVIPKIALGLTYLFSTTVLLGLLYLIFAGPGLINSIQMIWKL